jgi:hypothetical protein
MEHHSLLEELLDRRMETREQRRILTSVRCDLGEHVCASKSVREQPGEQCVQLRVGETVRFSPVHRVLRFASSGNRTQDAHRSESGGEVVFVVSDVEYCAD